MYEILPERNKGHKLTAKEWNDVTTALKRHDAILSAGAESRARGAARVSRAINRSNVTMCAFRPVALEWPSVLAGIGATKLIDVHPVAPSWGVTMPQATTLSRIAITADEIKPGEMGTIFVGGIVPAFVRAEAAFLPKSGEDGASARPSRYGLTLRADAVAAYSAVNAWDETLTFDQWELRASECGFRVLWMDVPPDYEGGSALALIDLDDEQDGTPVLNAELTAVPAGGTLQADDWRDADTGRYVEGIQPTAASAKVFYSFGPWSELPSLCAARALDAGMRAVLLKDGAAPAIGDEIGTAADEWGVDSGTGLAVVGLFSDDSVAPAREFALARPSGGGGGTGTVALVQATADGANGTVSVKAIAMRSDVTAQPNFDQTGAAYSLRYLRVAPTYGS